MSGVNDLCEQSAVYIRTDLGSDIIFRSLINSEATDECCLVILHFINDILKELFRILIPTVRHHQVCKLRFVLVHRERHPHPSPIAQWMATHNPTQQIQQASGLNKFPHECPDVVSRVPRWISFCDAVDLP
jgi:hypothetical protein